MDKAIEMPDLQGAGLLTIDKHALPHLHGGSISRQLSRMAMDNDTGRVEEVKSIEVHRLFQIQNIATWASAIVVICGGLAKLWRVGPGARGRAPG
jgi:hypothetical protein